MAFLNAVANMLETATSGRRVVVRDLPDDEAGVPPYSVYSARSVIEFFSDVAAEVSPGFITSGVVTNIARLILTSPDHGFGVAVIDLFSGRTSGAQKPRVNLSAPGGSIQYSTSDGLGSGHVYQLDNSGLDLKTSHVPLLVDDLRIGTAPNPITAVNFGTRTSGSTDASGDVTVNHGLGVTPVAVTVSSHGNNQRYAGEVPALRGSTTFTVRTRDSTHAPVAGVSPGFDWWALA